MAKKMQCYTIINVITSDKKAVYDVEDFALDVPVPSTGWLRMGENCSYYPIKAGAEVSIYISNWNNKIEFEAHVTKTHDKRFWFECDSMKESKKNG